MSEEKNCIDCLHFEACSKWTDFPKQIGFPVCGKFAPIAGCRKQEWISVDERLPEPFVSVLVYMPGEMPHPTVREGFINKRGEWYAGGFDRLPDEVVSWMKMPEPPKMKGGVEE